MLGNAAVFVFGALQHAGVSIGPLHEPTIVPASIVEVFCALALIGWSSAIKNANCRRSWPELAIVADCWRTTGKSEVIHSDEKRLMLSCDVRRAVRSWSAVCRLIVKMGS